MGIKERVQEVFNRYNVALQVDSLRVDMAEAVLENGTVIYTDADDFVEGEDAYIINDEGERIPLPPGDYVLADGGTISVGDLGKVTKVEKPQGGDAKNEGAPDAKEVKSVPNIDATKPMKRKEVAAPVQETPPAKQPPKKKQKLASEEEKEKDMKVKMNEEEVFAMLVEKFPDLGEELARAIAAAVAEVYAQPEEEEEVVEEVEAPAAVEAQEKKEEEEEKTELSSLKAMLEETNARLDQFQKFAAHSGLKHKAPKKKVEPADLKNMTTQERVRALAYQFSK